MFRHVKALHQLSRRTLTSSARRQVENKVPQKQKLFQLSFISGGQKTPENSLGLTGTVATPCSVTILSFFLTHAVENNGMPVHLKGGAGDAILYRTTMGLTILGTVFVIYELVKAALPQKKE